MARIHGLSISSATSSPCTVSAEIDWRELGKDLANAIAGSLLRCQPLLSIWTRARWSTFKSMQHVCSACGVMKQKAEFSNKQFAKGADRRRCKECVGHDSSPAAASSTQSPSRPSKTKKKSDRAAAGSATGPRVRVKDVQKHYGHLCEIPLEAYMEADVADSWNDFVTEEDVQKASDAWDARSIAHDIDTQWGAMPGGGAYKDSNHYYGPGEYDYY